MLDLEFGCLFVKRDEVDPEVFVLSHSINFKGKSCLESFLIRQFRLRNDSYWLAELDFNVSLRA